MSGNIVFPQSPFVDARTGTLAREWMLWLQNPQVLSIVLGSSLDVESGGTGLASGTSGGVLAFTSAEVIASSGELDASALVLGGGAGATPSTPIGLGTNHTVLHGNSVGPPSWGSVDLTADVSENLPIGNGGLGAAAFTPNVAAIQNPVIIKEWIEMTGTGGATRYLPLYGAP